MSTPRRRTRSMSGSEDEAPKVLSSDVPPKSAGSIKSSRKVSTKPSLATVAASPSLKAKKVNASSAKATKKSTGKRPREAKPESEPNLDYASEDSDAVWAPAAGSDDDDDDGDSDSDNEDTEVKDLEIDYTTGDGMTNRNVDDDRDTEGEGEEGHLKDDTEEGGKAAGGSVPSASLGGSSISNVLASSDAELAAERAEKIKARQLAKYKRFGEKLANRGVVYIAKVPPFMKVRGERNHRVAFIAFLLPSASIFSFLRVLASLSRLFYRLVFH